MVAWVLSKCENHRKKNRLSIYDDIITIAQIAPGVSILTPAYNEGKSIVQNARSLLSLHYGKNWVIIIKWRFQMMNNIR